MRDSNDERLLYKAWACLVGADSVTSLVGYRYGSRLPDDLRRDLLASSAECRRVAEEIKATGPLDRKEAKR